jgi:hypothetical protein
MDQINTVKLSSKHIFVLLALFLMTLNACQKRDAVRWDSDLLVPVLHSRLDVWDMFGDSNVVEEPDQKLKLLFQEELDLLDPDKVIVVHDTLSEELFNIPLYLQYAPGQQLIDKQNSVVMDLGDMELDKVNARVAVMKFYVTNTIKQPLRVRYEMLSSDKDGQTFVTYEDVPAATAAGPSYSVKTINLDGYTINMTGVSGNEVNTVVSRTQVWLHPDADSIWITPQDSVFIISTFDELKVEYVHGYFGRQDYNDQGSSAIQMFSSVKSGTFDLAHVNGILNISNYTGMDLQLSMDKISAYRNSDQKEVSLNDPVIGQTINIKRAVEKSYGLDYVIPTKVSYTLGQSNLDELIEMLPDSLRFVMSGKLNPMGNISGGNDFMYFDKSIIATFGLEIPMNLSVNNLLIEDTTEMDLQDTEELKSGAFYVYVDNMFPFDFNLQLYLTDQNGQIMDSLLAGQTEVSSAQIDQNGFAIAPSKNMLKIPLSEDMLVLLRKYKDVLIRARIGSYQNKQYQIYQNYYMDIRVVADVRYEL